MSYRQNIAIILCLWLLGFALEWVSKGRGVQIPGFPINLFLGILFVWVQGLIFYFRPNRLYAWLISIPLAVVSIVAMGLLVIVSGTFHPTSIESVTVLKYLGLSHVTRSWPYLLTAVWVASSLFISSLKRCVVWPPTLKNGAYVSAHLGLFVILLAGSLGSADLQRVRLDLLRGKPNWIAYDPDRGMNFIEMPFALRLEEFQFEEWPPQIVLVDTSSQKVLEKCPGALESHKPFHCTFEATTDRPKLEIELVSYLAEAFHSESAKSYFTTTDTGSSPAAQLKISVKKEGSEDEIVRGWIAMGSFLQAPKLIQVTQEFSIGMPLRTPKSFLSKVTYFTKNKETNTVSVEVNRPFSLEGWEIYQFGYDDQMGRWSNLSIVEAVRDPWLPIVYSGFFMLLLGVLMRSFIRMH